MQPTFPAKKPNAAGIFVNHGGAKGEPEHKDVLAYALKVPKKTPKQGPTVTLRR